MVPKPRPVVNGPKIGGVKEVLLGQGLKVERVKFKPRSD